MSETGRNWLRPMKVTEKTQDLSSVNVAEDLVKLMKGTIPAEDAKLDRQVFKLTPRKCFFYCGPAGTGKHRVAMTMAASLKKKGYECYTLRTSALIGADAGEAAAWAEELVELAGEQNIFFLMENPSRHESGMAFLETLMEELDYAGPSVSLVLVVTDTDAQVFRPEWQNRSLFCGFKLPNRIERMAYIKSLNEHKVKIDGNVVTINCVPFHEDIGYGYVADQTDQMSYGQLKSFMEFLKLRMKERAVSDPSIKGNAMQVIRGGNSGYFCADEDDITWAVNQTGYQSYMTRQSQKTSMPQMQMDGNFAAILAKLAMSAGNANQNQSAQTAAQSNDAEMQLPRSEKNRGDKRVITDEDLAYMGIDELTI